MPMLSFFCVWVTDTLIVKEVTPWTSYIAPNNRLLFYYCTYRCANSIHVKLWRNNWKTGPTDQVCVDDPTAPAIPNMAGDCIVSANPKVPQYPINNRKTWPVLKSNSQICVRADGMFLISGAVFDGTPPTIGVRRLSLTLKDGIYGLV